MNQEEIDKRYYAQRFGLWIALVSLSMVFAGFTSAYIVKKASGVFWNNFQIPMVFWISTVIIVFSSLTIHLAKVKFAKGNIKAYRLWLALTLLLGVAFCACQVIGWQEMVAGGSGILLQTDISGAFFYVITGTHVAHVLGGIGILLISLFRANKMVKAAPAEETIKGRKVKIGLVATYWHFVDILWLYLIFFLWTNHNFIH